MNEAQIPWWLSLLVAVATLGLAIWRSPEFKSQYRHGAVVLAIIYLFLMAFSIGGKPPQSIDRVLTPSSASVDSDATVLITSGVISVVTVVMLFGRPARTGQLVWFVVFSLANAGVCYGVGFPSIAVVLLLTGLLFGFSDRQAVTELLSIRASHLLPKAVQGQKPSNDVILLTAATGFIFGVLLIGTFRFGVFTETTRATASQRYSALPTRARIQAAVAKDQSSELSSHLMDQILDRRADIVVLLGVIGFLLIASACQTGSPQRPPRLE